jgi:tetratricopeptide (TPR) repeat protein
MASALASCSELLNSAHALLPPDANPDLGIHGLAGALRAAGKLDEAAALYSAALARCPETLTSADPEALLVCHHAGALTAEAGALDDAAPLLRTAVAGFAALLAGGERFHMASFFNVLISTNELADALERQRRATDAVALLDHAANCARQAARNVAVAVFVTPHAMQLEARRAGLRAKWWCAAAGCAIGGGGDTRLLRCGRCRAAAYCSAECQRAAWGAHRHVCVPAAVRPPAPRTQP